MLNTLRIKYCLLLPLILLCALQAGAKKVENNIIITEYVRDYTLVPDKAGEKIAEIKEAQTIRYKATRAEATAKSYVFYDDFTTVDKVKHKAKGIKPIYTSATSEGVFYDDSKMCFLPLPLEEVDKEMEVRFELTKTRPDLEPFIFIGDIYPVRHEVISFTMPIAFKDRYDIYTTNLPESAEITRQESPDGKNWIISITATDIPDFDIPDDAPSARKILPGVLLKGYFNGVDDLYTAMRSRTLEEDPDPEAVAAKAHEITDTCATGTDKAKAIYRWVHENIRYVAIEHGDLGHKPDLASEVLRKRYADCKGSANLIKAMLNAVGLDGRLVWIGTDEIPEDWTDRPVSSTGNHMIAALVAPDGEITYLDGTTGISDFGYYPPSIQGKQTLVEDGDKCIIGRVPVLDQSLNSDSVTLDLTLDGTSLKGKMTETVNGSYKAGLLNSFRDTDPHRHAKILKNFVTESRPAWVPENITVQNKMPDNGPTVISCDLEIQRAAKVAGGKTYIILNLFPQLESMVFDTKDRVYDGKTPTRKLVRRTARLTLPTGNELASLPEDVSVNNEWFEGSTAYRQAKTEGGDTVVDIEFSFKITDTYVPLDKMEQYNTAIKQMARAASAALTVAN